MTTDNGAVVSNSRLALETRCAEWLTQEMQLIREAMWRNDALSFVVLRAQVLERIDQVLLRYQEWEVFAEDVDTGIGEGDDVICQCSECVGS